MAADPASPPPPGPGEPRAGDPEPTDSRLAAARRAEEIGVLRIRRHLFLCCDAATPKCCAPEQARESWAYLKRRLDELGLTAGPNPGGAVARTKAACLRVCAGGPVGVVYPEGVWYAGLDPGALEEVIRGHLVAGRPVEKHRITLTSTGPSEP